MILKMIPFHVKLVTKAAQIGVRNIRTSSSALKNHYEALGLTRDATQADIKNAYFELSKIYHPDRIAATDENLAKFREISDAYEVLGNEQSRKLYDRGLVGDFKRPGVEEHAEVVDPIIRFYKKRQETIKPKSSEDLDAWAKTYYEKAREKASTKAQFYSVSRKHEFLQEVPQEYDWMIGLFFIGICLWLTNYSNNLASEGWDFLFGTGKKKSE